MPSLTTAPVAKPQVTPKFARLLEQRVFAPARAVGEELTVAAVTESPPPVTVWHPPQGGTWIAARHDADPVALARGATYAPKREIKRLKRMGRANVRFDVVLIGHELAGRWTLGDPVPEAYAPGAQAASSRVVAAQQATFALGRELLRMAAGAAGQAARGIGAVAGDGAAALAAVAAVDPLVLGGVRDPETGLIAWIELGAWYEEETTA